MRGFQTNGMQRAQSRSSASKPLVLTTYQGMRRTNVVDRLAQRSAPVTLGDAVKKAVTLASSRGIR